MDTGRERYVLAHDLGTSGNKAALFDGRGGMVSSARRPYRTYYPKPGYVEQNPADWWDAVCGATRELLAKSGIEPRQIECVAMCGHMMGCVLAGTGGAALRPAIIWADTRAAKQERELLSIFGLEAGYMITGHRLSASYTAAKMLWVRENEVDIFKSAERVLNAKDYILYRLTGNYVTDYSDASGTNILDLGNLRWSSDILRELRVEASLMPELHASTDVVGHLTPEAAEACGLPSGTPVVAGGGDGSCACVGAGAVNVGDVYGILGSSSWISSVSEKPLFDPEFRVFNWAHLAPGLYTPCGTMQASGVSAQWFADTLAAGVSVTEIDALAAKSPPGANGLIFLPYLLGERSPRWDADARGAYIGISATTGREDMARALIEGVGMNLRLIIGCLGIPQDTAITMIGGGAESDVWTGILADVWRRDIRLPEHLSEATSLGAALAGGIGVGMYKGFGEISQMNPPRGTVTPDALRAGVYDTLTPVFDAAYEGLRGVFPLLLTK